MVHSGKPAFSGFIANTHDALIVFEACRRGSLQRTQGRLSDSQRKAIKSGDVFVFSEEESKIKRWTDGRRWSPSRILNNFLIYRELEPQDANRPLPQTSDSITSGFGDDESDVSPPSKSNRTFSIPNTSTFQGRPPAASSSTEFFVDDKHAEDGERQKTRSLVGSLNADGKFKQNGFVKKTMSLCGLHMISYYDTNDVLQGRLRTPSSIPELMEIDLDPGFLAPANFRHPPLVARGIDGVLRFAGITDNEPMPRKAEGSRRERSDSHQTTGASSTYAQYSSYPCCDEGGESLLASPPQGAYDAHPYIGMAPSYPTISHSDAIPMQTSALGFPQPQRSASMSMASLASHLEYTGPAGRSASFSDASSSVSPRPLPRPASASVRHEPYRLPHSRSPQPSEQAAPASYPGRNAFAKQSSSRPDVVYTPGVGRQFRSSSISGSLFPSGSITGSNSLLPPAVGAGLSAGLPPSASSSPLRTSAVLPASPEAPAATEPYYAKDLPPASVLPPFTSTYPTSSAPRQSNALYQPYQNYDNGALGSGRLTGQAGADLQEYMIAPQQAQAFVPGPMRRPSVPHRPSFPPQQPSLFQGNSFISSRRGSAISTFSDSQQSHSSAPTSVYMTDSGSHSEVYLPDQPKASAYEVQSATYVPSYTFGTYNPSYSATQSLFPSTERNSLTPEPPALPPTNTDAFEVPSAILEEQTPTTFSHIFPTYQQQQQPYPAEQHEKLSPQQPHSSAYLGLQQPQSQYQLSMASPLNPANTANDQ